MSNEIIIKDLSEDSIEKRIESLEKDREDIRSILDQTVEQIKMHQQGLISHKKTLDQIIEYIKIL